MVPVAQEVNAKRRMTMALTARKLISIMAEQDPAAYDYLIPRFRGGMGHRARTATPEF
jgi:hypothetical protein